MLEKTDKNGIMKDRRSGVLVQNDINKLEAYKKQKKVFQNSQTAINKISDLEKEIHFIKEEIFKIRKILKEDK